MSDDTMLPNLQSLTRNNQGILELQYRLSGFTYPFVEKGPDGEWFFYLNPKQPKQKYLFAMADCMDDRNTHNPLILLLAVLQHFGLTIDQFDENMLQAISIFAPKIMNKTANAGPYTLRTISRQYYHNLALKYSDAIIVLPIVAHMECGAHGKNNLHAVLRRVEIVNEVNTWNISNLIAVPLISKTTQDHSLEVLDSYEEVSALVEKFADNEDDVEQLKTQFLLQEQLLKQEEEMNQNAKWLMEFLSGILEEGKSARVTRFLELDQGSIQQHNTKSIYTNLETVGLSQYVLDPESFITSYQHFHLDVFDFAHEENFDELIHELAVALHYTGQVFEDLPTIWYINVHWDNSQKEDFIERLSEEINSEYNPFSPEVKECMEQNKLIIILNEFDRENNLKRSEQIELDE